MLRFGSGLALEVNHLAQDNEVLAVEPNEMVDLRLLGPFPTSNWSGARPVTSLEGARVMMPSATMS